MNKVVLITGASSGIGKSVALYLQEKGYIVYGTSRDPKNYPKSPITLVPLDVRNLQQIQQCISYVKEMEGKIDVLINNAGVGITGPLEEIPMDAIKNQMETNLYGPIAMMQEVLPTMREQKSGLIINITSIAGYMGLPYRAPYSASKGALELISEGIRMEVAEFGIKVCTVAPGDFATNIAAGRFHAPLKEDSPYYSTYQNQLKQMNDHVAEGSDPMLLAKKVEKIIRNNQPKVHYPIGAFLQKFSIFLKKILPDTWYEKMLKNHYQLK